MLTVMGSTGAVADGEGDGVAVGVGSVVPQAARSATRIPVATDAASRLMGYRPFVGTSRPGRGAFLEG